MNTNLLQGRLRHVLSLLLSSALAGAPAQAQAQPGAAPPPAQAALPSYLTQELRHPRLAGQGDYRWFGLKIYQAGLWVGEQGYRGLAADGAPFVLVLRYARNLDGQKIAEASVEQMEKIAAGSGAQRASWLAQMKSIFPDVREGTQLGGAYLPGRGVRFYLDGKPLAELPDAAFAQAFFAIWLDPASSAPKLREALLRAAGPG